jgi:putative transposase
MYTKNPQMPKIRREAAYLVLNKGWSARKVGRYLGYHHTAVMKWVRRAQKIGYRPISTRSSRPRTHPRSIPESIERRIVELRLNTGRCTEAIHLMLTREGIEVSRNTVHRVIERHGLLKKRSPYKRYHLHVERPLPERPGSLVEVNTIHRMIDTKKRLYVFSLIDVHSRVAYAKAYGRMNGRTSVKFVREAEQYCAFRFSMIQSDHGPEFSSWFVSRIKRSHRHSRIGKPNDNAHIERFNRTLQEECLDHLPNNVRSINRGLKTYLRYYNSERVHLSIKTIPHLMVSRS